MKKVGLIAIIVIAAMLIAGCGNSNNADNKTTVNESLAVSSSVGNTENSNSEIVKENQSSTEITTTEPTTAETTTRKETTTTQKATQSNTTTKSATKQSTTQTKQTTTKKVTTTEAPYFCDEGGTHHSCEVGQIGWTNSFENAQDLVLEYISAHDTSGSYRVKQCFYCGKFTASVVLDKI
ncbi:hypothetical protein [Eubacterium sp.]|uniref:hypothetical protein n=1 Tax=Eubacterium sp. TaxID=142586 RepID=UPI003F0444D2